MKFTLEINLSTIKCKEELTNALVDLADDIDNGRCKLHALDGKVYDEDDDVIGSYAVRGNAPAPKVATPAPRKRARRAAKAPHPGAPPAKRGRGRPRKEAPAIQDEMKGA